MGEVEVLPRPLVELFEWAAVRERRDQLLCATAYTQVRESPRSEAQGAEVAIYRQALRNVPESGPDPFAVIWPERPAFLK
ncbi:phage tail assembly chaperone [Pseudomonas aeruginosa]|uniref:phage tail assembly chaperone n=1 Tax=Pseudomonas aeruginosa TaxID=287 RepID=UPI002117F8B9|nr:phage tail assembly chaperone [Pseudomonas aeruginosa]